MNSQNISFSQPGSTSEVQDGSEQGTRSSEPMNPSKEERTNIRHVSSFWHDRLIEGGLILSMTLYYIVGNPDIKFISSTITHLNPLLSLPFLLIFAALCWYRLPFALALLPLSLPYYLLQKPVFGHTKFSLVEITLWTCLAIAFVQVLLRRRQWHYWLSWRELRNRIGPFLIPILLFFVMAFISIFIAFQHQNALRAFREEVFDPLLFVGLALLCLRSRQDVTRLLAGLFSTGFIIAILGILQFFLFKSSYTGTQSGRIATVYGSGNSIGLLFDYALPIGLTLVASRLSWKVRLLALVLCLPFCFVLIESDSRGSWEIAMPLTLLFIIALAIRNRKVLVVSSLIFLVLCSGILAVYHGKIYDYVVNGHSNKQGDTTFIKRPYIWLSALDMIHDSPWLGYGMDNWLCHYSNSWFNVCLYPNGAPPLKDRMHGFGYYQVPPHPVLHAYMLNKAGLGDEPGISHPHNIFLHVWVSIGIFGLLAFVAILILFGWLFVRIFQRLRKTQERGYEYLRWMTVAVGVSMLAAVVHGQVDSSFLEQDLAFCFWILVTLLLLLRIQAGMSWADVFPKWRFLRAGLTE